MDTSIFNTLQHGHARMVFERKEAVEAGLSKTTIQMHLCPFSDATFKAMTQAVKEGNEKAGESLSEILGLLKEPLHPPRVPNFYSIKRLTEGVEIGFNEGEFEVQIQKLPKNQGLTSGFKRRLSLRRAHEELTGSVLNHLMQELSKVLETVELHSEVLAKKWKMPVK